MAGRRLLMGRWRRRQRVAESDRFADRGVSGSQLHNHQALADGQTGTDIVPKIEMNHAREKIDSRKTPLRIFSDLLRIGYNLNRIPVCTHGCLDT